MGTSDITVTALTATPGIGHNALKFSYNDPRDGNLPAIALDVVEVHAASTNDRSLATKIDEGKDKAAHMALVEGTSYYYWAKARNKLGNYGDWFPSGATSGVIGTVGFAAGAAHALINGKITASVASNILTVAVKTLSGSDPSALNPVYVGFRDQSGSYAVRAITSALSIAVPNGATLGSVSGIPFRIWVAFFDVGDNTVKIAVRNCSTATASFGLAEYGLASTVAVGTGSDSAGVFYTDSALTSVVFRAGGFIDFNEGQAVAGTWATDRSLVHLFGPGTKLPGDLVQAVFATNVTLSNGAYYIPFDDTIPQSNEGLEVFATPITPVSKVNFIENFAILNGSNPNSSVVIAGALFQDVGADAIAVNHSYASQSAASFALFDRRQPGTASQTTYKIRVGQSTNANMTINGFNNLRVFGGVLALQHVVREIQG